MSEHREQRRDGRRAHHASYEAESNPTFTQNVRHFIGGIVNLQDLANKAGDNAC